MKNKIMRRTMAAFLVWSLCLPSASVSAAEQSMSNEGITYEVRAPFFDYHEFALGKDGTFEVAWNNYDIGYPDNVSDFGYVLELADNNKFQNAKSYALNKSSITFNKSVLGKNGGTYYLRLKTRFKNTSGVLTDTKWSETKKIKALAINKKNFPGIYKLLKNGGRDMDMNGKIKKIVYDTNSDGWLDTKEIDDVLQLETEMISKKKNGVRRAQPSLKLSSLKGIEHLPNVGIVSLAHYSGTKIDVSKNKVWSLWVRGITSKKITVKAPDAKTVHIESKYSNSLKKMDLSACKSAVTIDAYGSKKTKSIKLPKVKKNLKVLSISDAKYKTLNLNKYKNLQQLYLYSCDVKRMKINKCKDLRYLYFFFVDKIKSVNVKANKKLRGIDMYSTPTLKKGNIKRPKKTKVTRQKGKWWYSTKAYKKDMKKL